MEDPSHIRGLTHIPFVFSSNGDGFVSRREFLGSRADFDRLDRDGDGLISPAEAEAAARKD